MIAETEPLEPMLGAQEEAGSMGDAAARWAMAATGSPAHATLRACVAAGGALSPASAERLAFALGGARRTLHPGETRAVRLNLARLGFSGREKLVRDTFRAHGLFVLEFLRGLRLEPDEIVGGWQIDGHEHFARLARRPGGFILAGAHTGNWEQLAALAALAGRGIVAPAATQLHPWLSPAIGARKRARGVTTVDPAASPRSLASALGEGALIGLPLDGGSFRRGRQVRLRGARVRLAAGAARLALLSGRPVVPMFALRTGFMRQHVRIHPPLSAADFSGSPAERLSALAQALADLLGDHLASAAGQWCIFRPLAWYDEGTSDPITQGDAS